MDPQHLIGLIQSDPRTYRLDGQSILRFKADMSEAEDRIEQVRKLLAVLSGQGQAAKATQRKPAKKDRR